MSQKLRNKQTPENGFRMFICTLFIALPLFFVSCSEDAPEPESILHLNPYHSYHEVLSSFISEVDYISLETDQMSFIGNVEKIKASEDRLYLLDARVSNALYVYDYDGNLDYKISNYGRGPGEFMGPYDFTIDEEEGEIIIFDAGGLKLSRFNLNDGSFIEDTSLEFRFSRFNAYKDGFIFFLNNISTSDGGYNVIRTDRELNVLDNHLEMNPNMLNYVFALPTNFSRYQDSIFLTIPADDQIYRFDQNNGNVENYLYVDFGNASLPETYFRNHPDRQSRRDAIGNSAHNISNYFEADDFYFFRYSRGAQGAHLYIQSKQTDEVIHTTNELLEDDLNIGPLPLWPMAITDDTLIWYAQPAALRNYIRDKQAQMSGPEWSRFQEENQKLITFSESIVDNDNPYLILTKIEF